MNWDAIGAVGEWAGALAVVATLFYLALQMRQSRQTERAVAQRDLLLRVSEWTRMVNQPGASEYDRWVLGIHEYDQADAQTQMHVDMCLSEFVFIAEAALNMRKDGFFSDGTWLGIIGAATALLRTPGGEQWWKYGQQFIGREIVEFLNEELAKIEPDTPNFLDFLPALRKRARELADQATN